MQEVVVLALSLHICLTEQPGFKSRGLYLITDSQIHCIIFSPAPWLQYYQTETWPQNAWLVYQLPHWAIINHSRVLLGLWGKLKRSVPTQHLVAPWGTLQLPVCGVAASQQCHLWHAGTVRCMWHAGRPGLCSCVSLCWESSKVYMGPHKGCASYFRMMGKLSANAWRCGCSHCFLEYSCPLVLVTTERGCLMENHCPKPGSATTTILLDYE